MHSVKVEITVSRSMSHMLWDIGADRGQLLWLCGKYNEIKWFMWTLCVFTSKKMSWCWLKEGLTEKKNMLSNHSLLLEEFSDLLKKAFRLLVSPSCIFKDSCPLCWMYCVCGLFFKTISVHYGAVLLGRMSTFKTLHVSCQNCMWTVIF